MGNQDSILPPRLSLGSLCPSNIVSLPAGISELPGEAPSGETVATVSAHMVERSTLATIEAIDLSPLTQQEQGDVRSLLRKYQSVFSTHDGDLGCTNLISHEIPLLDDAPVRQRFRRIPPSQYEAVKDHIHQLLENGISEGQVRGTKATNIPNVCVSVIFS